MTQIMKRNYEKPATTLIMLDNCLNLLQASQVDLYEEETEEQY